MLVVACPGSGKTRLIISKIGRIESLSPANRVCAVTFTRDAANELTHRVEQEHGSKILEKCRIGTFHSLAIGQLRDADLLGKLATPQQQSTFINQAARASSTPDHLVSYEEAVERLEKAKCTLIQDPALMSDPVVASYQRMLARNRMRDLYDVIREAVIGMREGTVRHISVGRLQCTHLLVDEFQDCDEVQYAWMMEHVKAGLITTVVGDDDQTIYAFRRALGYKGMTDFRDEAGAQEITLGVNYRCRAEILHFADNLIRHNVGQRIEKRLVAEKGIGGFVKRIRGGTPNHQAEYLVECIEPFLEPIEDDTFDYTVRSGAWAIIARNHAGLHIVEKALYAKRIKYQRSSGGFWKQYFIAVYLGFLKSIQLGDSVGIDIALSYIGVADESVEVLHRLTEGRFSQYLNGKMKEFPGVEKSDAATMTILSQMATSWRAALREGNYPLVINGVSAYLQDTVLYKQADADKKEMLADAAAILVGLGNRSINTPGGGKRSMSLAERVDLVQKPRKSKDTDGVVLHTMHSCKGLEFDQIGLFNISQGVLPDPEREDDYNDRRLLYVGITRGKEQVYMTYKAGAQSRFFTEMGLTGEEHELVMETEEAV